MPFDLFAKPRLTGALFFIVGIIALAMVVAAHQSEGPVLADSVWISPILVLLGLAILVEPRILMAMKPGQTETPRHYRMVGIIIAWIGLAIGVVIRVVVFKHWNVGGPH